MKKIRIFSIVLFAAAMLLAGFRFAEDFLYWTPERKLSGTDFKANPDPGSSMEAMTNSGITYSWQCQDGQFTYEVASRFDRLKSWMKPGAERVLLGHEQLHFDITELYARKMRKAFSTLQPPCRSIRPTVESVADEIYREWDALQDEYDRATRHGIDKSVQKAWETRIRAELEKYAEWAVQ